MDSVLFYKGNVLRAPILIAERSNWWVCGRSLAGIAGSNRIGGMVVSLLGLLRVERSLRRADHSCRRVLPSVVCLNMIMKPR